MTYEEQLSFKQAKVIKLLGRFCRVDRIIGMKEPYHYRNKVQAAFGTTRSGRMNVPAWAESPLENLVLSL